MEVVSVQMDNQYTFLPYRQIDGEREIRQGEFLVPAKAEGVRYMLLLDMAEKRADTLFKIDDVIGEDDLATFDINDDQSIVRITTPSTLNQNNSPAPNTTSTIFIDLKNQTYRNIGNPITYRWTDTGYQYKTISDEECLQNSRSLEPIVDPRCDRLIDRTPWTTYVQH